MAKLEFDQLLEAGAHFGHLKRKWNPAMAPYIFMERNGIHIIDLHKTIAKTEGSLTTIPSPAMATRVLAVPRSIAMSVDTWLPKPAVRF